VVCTELSTAHVWEFAGPDGPIAVPVAGRLRVSTSDAMREALLEGLGVGVAPFWMWRDELREGRLEAVLQDFEPTPRPVQAVFPERRLVSPKVRAFVDFLAEEFRLEPRGPFQRWGLHAATGA
jgi:DNA-binding transcriptional LysR family regulator